MKEKLRENEYGEILKKEDDIIIILSKLDEMQFTAKALISEIHIAGNETDPVNAVALIQQREYEEFSYMVEDEFFDKVKEIYQKVKNSEMSLKEIAEKIKEELERENEKLLYSAYEE